MAAKLDKTLKRQLQLGEGLFVLTISPDSFKLVRTWWPGWNRTNDQGIVSHLF